MGLDHCWVGWGKEHLAVLITLVKMNCHWRWWCWFSPRASRPLAAGADGVPRLVPAARAAKSVVVMNKVSARAAKSVLSEAALLSWIWFLPLPPEWSLLDHFISARLKSNWIRNSLFRGTNILKECEASQSHRHVFNTASTNFKTCFEKTDFENWVLICWFWLQDGKRR